MKKNILKSLLSLSLILLVVLGMNLTAHAGGESDSIVAACYSASYVIKNDGSLWGWGQDFIGNGEGWDGIEWTPVQILEDVRSVSCSDYQRAAVKKDNSLWIWGKTYGQYNGECDPNYLIPTKVLEDVNMVSCGNDYIMILKTDGSVWVNNFLVGDGTTNNQEGFVKVIDGCKYISAGISNAYVIKDDDTLWGWGYNSDAEIGLGDTEEVLVPTKILDDVREIHGYSGTIMAVRLDNSLYSWGAVNNNGVYTENGWVENPGTPYKVMDDVQTAMADDNGYQMAVIKTNDTLWGWGDDGDFVSSMVPVELYSNVETMALGTKHIVVVFNDHTLGTAGDNDGKVLAHGDIDNWGETTSLELILSDIQDSPSSWAVKEVEEAIGLELIPNELQGDYKKSITREEFCELAVILIEVKTDMDIEDYITDRGLEMATSDTFSDTTNPDILAAKTLSITDGYPDGTFKPDNALTREQAAKFLSATARAMGQDINADTPSYEDLDSIANWAKPYVGYVYDIGVMKGVGGNNFSPKSGYQRQQAILTILRVFKAIDEDDVIMSSYFSAVDEDIEALLILNSTDVLSLIETTSSVKVSYISEGSYGDLETHFVDLLMDTTNYSKSIQQNNITSITGQLNGDDILINLTEDLSGDDTHIVNVLITKN